MQNTQSGVQEKLILHCGTDKTYLKMWYRKLFSHTFVEKIEMNLLNVCKLCPVSLAQLLKQDKKSRRQDSNVSSQSNPVLQARLCPCYNSGKLEFKAGKCSELRKHQQSLSLEMF